MDYLADELGVVPVRIATMRREVGPADLPALVCLGRELRRYRPDVVHTEAAKAGTLGRLAVLVAFRPRHRPVVVHTFHGHSLEGYFSPRRARFFLAVERLLARGTSLVIAVSDEIKLDLVRLSVTSAERIRVVPLGLPLDGFRRHGERRALRREEKRAEWGIQPGELVVALIARLVPIKRVDRFLRVAERLAALDDRLRFVVVGDGELGDRLRASDSALRLSDRLHWAGLERDMPAVCFASDCVVLTSDNEGTPVSLIEAQVAGVPVVSTRVGGAASVVAEGTATGRLVEADDEAGFATAVLDVLARAGESEEAARASVAERFSLERLVADLTELYRSLLESRVAALHTASHSPRSADEIGPAR